MLSGAYPKEILRPKESQMHVVAHLLVVVCNVRHANKDSSQEWPTTCFTMTRSASSSALSLPHRRFSTAMISASLLAFHNLLCQIILLDGLVLCSSLTRITLTQLTNNDYPTRERSPSRAESSPDDCCRENCLVKFTELVASGELGRRRLELQEDSDIYLKIGKE
ncbi:hypothetical protein PC129_g8101 [Phytophthora cactorum]|uniref:Uncharacterized protein n=1 Tax=Phytophthora cactorum TaxID=29920 RepID=A0A8T1A4E9_9STRA|nr:hypothetical protein PC111_g662 [Phytophthora cactorum]KAG2849758.1 hypothetical protein PC112_g9 [Phytophthora cactorum]KAG2869331.1 hypothetical protein PC113_g261 [Phytophthora cactorum]KAG2936323.1 hypothetical protein PC114_g315 [Phytophthora cactorum]KAG3036396.1 hypothetical protein PC120_g255 [Phytophthora cactorum]